MACILGNVQATILDRTSPILENNEAHTLLGYRSNIASAQDYYPFGMLMPGRYIADTGKHCVTVNTTVMVPKIVKLTPVSHNGIVTTMQYGLPSAPPTPVSQLPVAPSFALENLYVYHYLPAEEHEDGQVATAVFEDSNVLYTIDLSREPDDISMYLQLHADTSQTEQAFGFTIPALSPEEYTLSMRVRQYYAAGSEEYYQLIDWQPISVRGPHSYTMAVNKTAVKAGGKTVLELRVSQPLHQPFKASITLTLATPYTLPTTLVPEGRIVTICDEQDNYRFSFNGIEKVNEIAGIGNHYTALFGEYDPRTVYRWNTDPKANPWESPYAMFGGNPIINTDVLLDKFNKWDTKSSNNVFSFNGYKTNTKYFADEANLNNFNSAALSLVKSNAIFNTVARQLYHSEKVYTIQQKYKSTASYDDASKTIEIPYRGIGKDASISKTEVFEEVFHAGQDDYYSSRGMKRSTLENEVEAKVADILSGHQDDAVNDDYGSIKGYFQTGKKDKNFNKQLDKLIGDVNQLYSDYDNTEGKQWSKENDPKKVDKANVLNYLESVTDVKSKGK